MTTITPNNLADKNYVAPAKSWPESAPGDAKPRRARAKRSKRGATDELTVVGQIAGIPRKAQRAQIEYLSDIDGFRLTVDGAMMPLPPDTRVTALMDSCSGDTKIMLSFGVREAEIAGRVQSNGRRRARRSRAGKGGTK